MILIFCIWLMSSIGMVLFVPWMYEKGLSVPMATVLIICPIINTLFFIYRTYKALRYNSDKILAEFKKLFED